MANASTAELRHLIAQLRQHIIARTPLPPAAARSLAALAADDTNLPILTAPEATAHDPWGAAQSWLRISEYAAEPATNRAGALLVAAVTASAGRHYKLAAAALARRDRLTECTTPDRRSAAAQLRTDPHIAAYLNIGP